MIFTRNIEQQLNKWIKSKEVIMIYGARQVGKTTFIKNYLKSKSHSILLNCELPEVSEILSSLNVVRIKQLFGNNKIIALDEAQSISNIGLILKLIYDEMGECKIIATGSSSFDLSSHVAEALTGRNIKFEMFPLSMDEIEKSKGNIQLVELENETLIYGSYPEIVDIAFDRKQIKIRNLSSDYLFRDVLIHERIKSPDLVRTLLRALALQIGSQVSHSELANILKVSRQTVVKYIELLEKSFIIFRLKSYSSNLRSEIKRSSKYYFYDIGIRNAIINNFAPISLRNDVGAIWENFCISERIKYLRNNGIDKELFFWRSYDGAEIDLIEIKDQQIDAFEFKWRIKRKVSIPKTFKEKYSPKSYKIITRENYFQLNDPNTESL
jgi:predicted AAA+ superfamily ATPase